MTTTTPYLMTTTVRTGPVEYRKGVVVHLTAGQVTTVGAANLRSLNNALNANGTHPATETHDTLGEATGVSNTT